MRVFVTGGTGAVGSHAVPALVAAGHAVSALARTPEKAAALAAQGATPVIGSLFDRRRLRVAFADHDAVANLATAIPPSSRFMFPSAWRDNERIRSEGSACVVDAAMDAGVSRLVQESVVMIYPDQGATWVEEDVTPDRYPLALGNLAAEASTRRFTERGVGVVLRFGWFYGPGAAHCEEMFARVRRHVALQVGPPTSYVSSIHLEDAATAVVAALGAPTGTYNVVDDEPLTKQAFSDAAAAAVGVGLWLRVPGRAAGLFGERLTSLERSVRASNRRFRSTTGWAPRYPSAREGWRATAAVLAAR